jgi:hypothetical protein
MKSRVSLFLSSTTEPHQSKPCWGKVLDSVTQAASERGSMQPEPYGGLLRRHLPGYRRHQLDTVLTINTWWVQHKRYLSGDNRSILNYTLA